MLHADETRVLSRGKKIEITKKKRPVKDQKRVLQQYKISNTEIFHCNTDKTGYKSKASQQVRTAYKRD